MKMCEHNFSKSKLIHEFSLSEDVVIKIHEPENYGIVVRSEKRSQWYGVSYILFDNIDRMVSVMRTHDKNGNLLRKNDLVCIERKYLVTDDIKQEIRNEAMAIFRNKGF